jgi:hypothetical protein
LRTSVETDSSPFLPHFPQIKFIREKVNFKTLIDLRSEKEVRRRKEGRREGGRGGGKGQRKGGICTQSCNFIHLYNYSLGWTTK